MKDLRWDDLDEVIVDDACTIADVNRALRRVFDVIDPDNSADLGGEAAHFFSGEKLAAWWYETADFKARRRRLDQLLTYLFAVSIEEWHDDYVARRAMC